VQVFIAKSNPVTSFLEKNCQQTEIQILQQLKNLLGMPFRANILELGENGPYAIRGFTLNLWKRPSTFVSAKNCVRPSLNFG
jgi:hypothetical protein